MFLHPIASTAYLSGFRTPVQALTARAGRALTRLRTAKARAYICGLIDEKHVIAVHGPLGDYSKAVLARHTVVAAGDPLAKMLVSLDHRELPASSQYPDFAAFRLDPARPDLARTLVKKLVRETGVEFNLSRHWSEPPSTTGWIRSPALEAALEGLQQEAFLLMRKKAMLAR